MVGPALLVALAACAAPEPAPAPAPPAPRTPAVPGDVLNLANWKLTLPTGAGNEPEEIHPPQLTSFSDDFFRLDDTRDGVVFTANAGGVTTNGSSYPRCELREMDGGALASWSNRAGTHTMTLREAITKLPEVKPHVVAAQIHDAENDVVMVRLEGTHLFVEYDDGEGEFTLDEHYALGTPYDLRITAANGRVQVAYNGRQAGDVPLAGDGWYFKAGTYTQSNPERGEAPAAVGEVVIYSLDVQHTP
ncbi:polysaccharide lyase family 7 protein [Pseudonocardia adelaidensis]|uniref:polysaccharide lyase family 7 protein n=1 Tax=Pseudonocardia adelaidensis TaxID=648754 RepID=UPI0031ED251A